jgi:hypothetical protein
MTWIETASINEFIAEMRRKPDANLLLEWIEHRAAQGLDTEDDARDALADIIGMVTVYTRALEEA